MKASNKVRLTEMKSKLRFNAKRSAMLAIFLVGALSFVPLSFSQDSKGIGRHGATFLQISPSARQVAMGEAAVGLADDINVMRYNIGGLGNIRKKTMAINFHKWIQDTQQGAIGFAVPHRFGVLGIDLAYFNEGEIVELDKNFEPTGGSSYSDDLLITIGHASRLRIMNNYLSFGGGLKYIRQNLVGISSSALGLDFGFDFRLKHLSVGAAIQNIPLTKLKFAKEETPLPEIFRCGIAARLPVGESIKLNFDADAVWISDQKMRYYTGGEIIISNLIALRGGYKIHNTEPTRLGTGFGLIIPTDWLAHSETRIDYSYSPMSAFEETAHRFSLIFTFGAIEPGGALNVLEARIADYDVRLREQLEAAEKARLSAEDAERRMKALEDSINARLARIQRIAAESEGKIEVEPKTREKILVSMRINFDFDKANIRREEFATMKQVGQILNTYPESRVWVSGHTDNFGPDEYNILLSHRRVDSVMTFLTKRERVSDDRFYMPVGYGEMKPIETNETDEGRFRNRRVEFLLYTLGSEPEMPEGSAVKTIEAVNDTIMQVVCNGKVNYKVDTMEMPDRLILDLPGIFILTDQSIFEINRGPILRARLGYHSEAETEGQRFTRVVFDLKQPIKFTVESKDNFIFVHVH